MVQVEYFPISIWLRRIIYVGKNNMKILITGGAGFIGSNLVDRLMEKTENEIVVYDNLSRGRLDSIKHHINNNRFSFIQSDLRNFQDVQNAMQGIDVVYHLGAQSNVMGAVNDPRYSFDTNVIGSFNVLQAAREQSVQRVLFSSSREVYGDALYLPVDEFHPLGCKNPYGASKVAGEMYCRVYQKLYGLDVIILRLSNIFGLRDYDRVIPIWIENVLRNQELTVFGGNQIIDFLPVKILVDVLFKSLTIQFDHLPINIGTGKGTAILDLAKYIIEATGSSSTIKIVEGRKAEVNSFIADVTRMTSIFNTHLDVNISTEILIMVKSLLESNIPNNNKGKPQS